MAIESRAAFQCTIDDDATALAAGQVTPSRHNQGVAITLDSDRLMGRATAGNGAVEEITCTAAGRALLDDADAATQRTTLGLGTAAPLNVGTGANNVVQLDGSARLPAVDGSQLTGISAGGTPGGSDTQVQFNDSSAFGGDSGLTFNKTTKALTVGGATVTADAPVLNLTQTWNNAAVTFGGFRLNVTDTASAAASSLFDFQVGGASRGRLTKAGRLVLADDFESTASFPRLVGGVGFVFRGAATDLLAVTSSSNGILTMPASASFGWGSFTALDAQDVTLVRDAADTLAQRRGTNAQTERIYGTYTDASNYRRVAVGMSTGGTAFLRPEGAGTGATGNVLHISGLPTSNPGAGILWNNGGVVEVGT
jgi:hypothetical protein